MGDQVRIQRADGHVFIISESEVDDFQRRNPGAVLAEVSAAPALEAAAPAKGRRGRPPGGRKS